MDGKAAEIRGVESCRYTPILSDVKARLCAVLRTYGMPDDLVRQNLKKCASRIFKPAHQGFKMRYSTLQLKFPHAWKVTESTQQFIILNAACPNEGISTPVAFMTSQSGTKFSTKT